MDIQQAVKTVLASYSKFDGRSGRAEFWWWALAIFLGYILVTAVGGLVGMGWLTSTVFWLATIVPSAAVAIRRFHDIGKPAIWAVLMIIPFVNIVVALLFLTKASEGSNQYGEGPQGPAA